MGTRLLFAIIVSLILSLASARAEETIRSYVSEDTDDMMKACAIGRTLSVNGDVKAGIARFLTKAYAGGQASISDLGAIFDRIKPDDSGAKIYEIYTKCLKDQAEIKLKTRQIKVGLGLKNVRPIVWDVFPGNRNYPLSTQRITISSDRSTTIEIIDAACEITIWMDDIASPKDFGSNEIDLYPPEGYYLSVIKSD